MSYMTMGDEIHALRTTLARVEAERDDIEYRYHLLASEMVYEGNSVQHWQQKAMAYKECAGAVYDLKQLVGAGTPAEVVKAVQALAAHVERLREGLHHALVLWGPHCTDEEGSAYAECEKRCDEAPATSLARLKAEWQAEALERIAAEYSDISYSDLQLEASELRRQASASCPGPGKCNDPGCPAHYAHGGTHDTPQESG